MRKKLTPTYKYAGVYMIRNERNGKVYIGSSSDIEGRIAAHRRSLARGDHICHDLQHDYNLRHPMTTDVLYVEPVPYDHRMRNRNKLFALEWKFIEEYNSIENGYNSTPISKIRQDAL